VTAQDWERASAGHGLILFRCLVNTLRLARGPREVAGVLGLLGKALLWRLSGATAPADQTLRLQGVAHVVGLGTGELLLPQEIYWERGYDQLADFVPRPGWTVIDAGANTGVYAVQQARRGARVFAFEPNPDCFRRLRKAVQANGVEDRVIAFDRALGAAPGPARLFLPAGVTTMGSLRPEWDPAAAGTGFGVEVETLEDVLGRQGIERVDLLKVDVEGFELDVLRGAGRALRRVERVVVEYHSLDLGRRVAELLAAEGLTTVFDQKMYGGDEDRYRGVGRGLLFAGRRAGNPVRSAAVA
jgi:FkbM family methyltransferase